MLKAIREVTFNFESQRYQPLQTHKLNVKLCNLKQHKYDSNSSHEFIIEGLTKNSPNESVFKYVQDIPIFYKKIIVEQKRIKNYYVSSKSMQVKEILKFCIKYWEGKMFTLE